MRKVIFFIYTSLDGFVAGANGEMDWIVHNDEVQRTSYEMQATVDAAIYGRVTYQMMESYWPLALKDPTSSEDQLEHARWVDQATKIVFSRTLKTVTWHNTRLIHANIAEEMATIKQEPGKNLWLLGSVSIAQLLMRLDLIDDYRIYVNPVVLGRGRPLFTDQQIKLKLLEAKTLKGGVVALRYEPDRTNDFVLKAK